MFPERLQTFGHVRNIDEEQRRVQVVVSTGDLARDDAIIDQSGWVFTNYDRNPVVLWAHDDHSLPIAKAIASLRQQTENELIETHEFADHPRAEEVWNAVRGGFVSATSVRWLPGKTTMRQVNGRSVLVFTEGHELLESSYVPIPADPGCLVVRADGSPLDIVVFDPETFRSGAATPEPEMYCRVADCRNPAPMVYALCDECSELLDTARKQRAAQPDERAQRLIALADRIRTTNHQEGAA